MHHFVLQIFALCALLSACQALTLRRGPSPPEDHRGEEGCYENLNYQVVLWYSSMRCKLDKNVPPQRPWPAAFSSRLPAVATWAAGLVALSEDFLAALAAALFAALPSAGVVPEPTVAALFTVSEVGVLLSVPEVGAALVPAPTWGRHLNDQYTDL
jgi:hypothetical protein